MARPPLSIVDPDATSPSPPRALGRHGQDLWRSIMREYHITDPGGLELLAQAAAALDRAEALSEAIGVDVVVHSRSGPKPHPALAAELANRSFVARTIERLGLNLETVRPIGRPGVGKGHAD